MNRIKLLSTLAMVLMAPMVIAYPFHEMSWILELSFLDWGKWTRNDAWVYPYAEIALSTRMVFCAVWTLPVIGGLIAYFFAFKALIHVRRGDFFAPVVARSLTWVGVMTAFSSGMALLAGALSPMIRSWHNPDGPLPLRFWYNGGNIGMFYCGIAFFFIGLIMREAIRIDAENKEFI